MTCMDSPPPNASTLQRCFDFRQNEGDIAVYGRRPKGPNVDMEDMNAAQGMRNKFANTI